MLPCGIQRLRQVCVVWSIGERDHPEQSAAPLRELRDVVPEPILEVVTFHLILDRVGLSGRWEDWHPGPLVAPWPASGPLAMLLVSL